MAQIIKHRRGTIAELNAYSGLQKGELGVTTGSLSGITTPILHLGDGSGDVAVGRLLTGTSVPNISSYSQYNHLLFHDTDDNILYRLHSGGNVNIDLTGNIANREIAGNVSGSSTSTGSFGRLEVANLSATTVDLTGDITFDDVTATGNIVTTGANKVISGSSTSTGSFGMGLFADRVGVGTTAPATIFHISSSGGLIIPDGTTAQRSSTGTRGEIRFNTSLSTYEGYDGSNWGSLGGVIDVDQDTYVTAETSAGTDNDEIKFYTKGTLGWTMGVSGSLTGSVSSHLSASSASTGSFGRIDARDLVIDATHGGSGNSGLYVGAPKTTIGGHMELAGTGTQYFVMSREGSLSGGDNIGTIVWANDNDSVAGINVIADTADDDAKMTFWTQTTGPTYAERMVLDSTGNLGIGVTNPTNTLDVSGNISATSHITGSGNLEITGNISGSSTSTGSFGYLNVSGNGVFGGDITFGDANTDSVSFGADISSNLIPNADDTYDLGSATQAWQDLFLEGDITLSDAGAVQATAGNLQIDSLAATLVLDGHTGVDIDASNSGKVAIDGAGGIDIGVAADVAIDVDADTFDLDASGALTLDSTASVGLGTANSGVAISIGHTVSETTINDNLTITGDLTVNGDQTIISTTNLAVGDAFIFAATGSAGTNVDGGLIVQSGSAVDSGSAIYHDVNDERWAVAKGVKSTATSLTALQHVVTGDFSKTTSPDSTSGSYGVGEMWIDDSSDIWIRTG